MNNKLVATTLTIVTLFSSQIPVWGMARCQKLAGTESEQKTFCQQLGGDWNGKCCKLI